MALFEFGAEGKKEEREPAEMPQEKPAGGNVSAVLNDGRRFFFVAEEVVAVRAGTVVRGVVHGRIELDDAIVVLQPHKPTIRTVVKGMDARIESYMMKVQTATDMQVNLFMPVNPADVEKFSVVTGIDPALPADAGEVVENPVVAALLYEKKLFSNAEYFDWLCFSLVQGRFVTPVRMARLLDEKDTSVGFNMIPDPRNDKERLLPVFTDRIELDKGEYTAKDEKVQTAILGLPDIVAVVEKFRCSGFVVNPYSGNQSIITKEILSAITESEGYKQVFPS